MTKGSGKGMMGEKGEGFTGTIIKDTWTTIVGGGRREGGGGKKEKTTSTTTTTTTTLSVYIDIH